MSVHQLQVQPEESEAEWLERKRAYEAAVAKEEQQLAAVRAAIAQHLKRRE